MAPSTRSSRKKPTVPTAAAANATTAPNAKPPKYNSILNMRWGKTKEKILLEVSWIGKDANGQPYKNSWTTLEAILVNKENRPMVEAFLRREVTLNWPMNKNCLAEFEKNLFNVNKVRLDVLSPFSSPTATDRLILRKSRHVSPPTVPWALPAKSATTPKKKTVATTPKKKTVATTPKKKPVPAPPKKTPVPAPPKKKAAPSSDDEEEDEDEDEEEKKKEEEKKARKKKAKEDGTYIGYHPNHGRTTPQTVPGKATKQITLKSQSIEAESSGELDESQAESDRIAAEKAAEKERSKRKVVEREDRENIRRAKLAHHSTPKGRNHMSTSRKGETEKEREERLAREKRDAKAAQEAQIDETQKDGGQSNKKKKGTRETRTKTTDAGASSGFSSKKRRGHGNMPLSSDGTPTKSSDASSTSGITSPAKPSRIATRAQKAEDKMADLNLTYVTRRKPPQSTISIAPPVDTKPARRTKKTTTKE